MLHLSEVGGVDVGHVLPEEGRVVQPRVAPWLGLLLLIDSLLLLLFLLPGTRVAVLAEAVRKVAVGQLGHFMLRPVHLLLCLLLLRALPLPFILTLMNLVTRGSSSSLGAEGHLL